MSKKTTKCRCCLTTDTGMKNMFVEGLQCANLKLSDGYTNVTGLTEFQEDETKVFICYACEFQLKNAYLFRKLCLESDEILKNATEFVKIENIDDEIEQMQTSEPEMPPFVLAEPKNEDTVVMGVEVEQVDEETYLEDVEEDLDDDEMMIEVLEEYVEEVKKSKKIRPDHKFADDIKFEDLGEQVDDATMDLEAQFFCYLCSIYLPSYRDFVQHRSGHEEQVRQRKCEFCNKTVNGYTKHLWSEHPEYKPYKCVLCKFTASRAVSLKRHLYFHTHAKNYKCLLCDIYFKSAAQLRAHTSTSTKRHCNNGFNCPYCGLAFRKVAAFIDHVPDKHPEVKAKILPCYDCKRIFHVRKAFDEHLLTCEKLALKKGLVKSNNPANEIQCTICEAVCVNEEHKQCHDLIYHERGMDDEVGVTCPDCDKVFPNAATYKRHQLVHSTKEYQCDECGLCLNSVSKLKKHKLIHTDVRTEQCGICGARFKHKNNLKTHEKTHLPKHKTNECNECGKMFANLGQLKLHMSIHFEELKVHACDLCDRRFARTVDKEKHMRTHRGERNYKCEMCNKSYYTHFALKDHAQRVHDQFRFECKFCNKKYARNKSLYEHIFTHKNVKPYTCPGCQAQYVKKELFKKHMRKRHNIEYSEVLHGYKETFQEVLMWGLKTDADPSVAKLEIEDNEIEMTDDDGDEGEEEEEGITLEIMNDNSNINDIIEYAVIE